MECVGLNILGQFSWPMETVRLPRRPARIDASPPSEMDVITVIGFPKISNAVRSCCDPSPEFSMRNGVLQG